MRLKDIERQATKLLDLLFDYKWILLFGLTILILIGIFMMFRTLILADIINPKLINETINQTINITNSS